MDSEELEPMDILAFTTEELQGRLREKENEPAVQAKIIQHFLERWETDVALEGLRKMKIGFEKDLDWFNVSTPLSMESLQGKLLILDFFTYCCINCMHVLPELHALEQLYPIENGLVVIGVHSPKFENEKDASNILAAAQRYNITHPIVNDPRTTLWRSIGIRCWPTLLVLSPKGVPILLLMGEGHFKLLEVFVDQALRHFERKGEISKLSLPLSPSLDMLPASNLRFPAKITRSISGELFAIADAGNNRILIINYSGKVKYKVGGYNAGFIDGDFTTSRFNSPQGVAFFNDDVLIVADTENHAIRQITLSAGQVVTMAGTGQQGTDRIGGKLGPLQDISSPWDVAIYRTRDMDMSFHLNEHEVQEKPIILVSMAGTHQIWGYFPEGMIWWKFRKFEPRTCVSIIGNGMEENRNNSYPQNAAFAQPSGLAMAKDALFIADSESSSIRKVSMVDGKVTGVVGGDRNPLNLFAFGDIDGKQYNAKLQHPLGVTYNHIKDKVYVADTYNHKIKVIDTQTNTIDTLCIRKRSDELLQLNEPAGLCVDAHGQYLLVSDTNNHDIQIIDLETLIAERFLLDFSDLLQYTVTDGESQENASTTLVHLLALQHFKYLKLTLNFILADELKFTIDAPQKWKITTTNSTFETVTTSGNLNAAGQLIVPLHRSNEEISSSMYKEENVQFNFTLSLCDANSCLMKRFALILKNSPSDTNQNECRPKSENVHLQNETQDENLKNDKQIINLHISSTGIQLI